MIQDLPAQPSTGIFSGRAAFNFGLALFIGLLLTIIVLVLDRNQRTKMETSEEITAVGDQAFFKIPDTFPRPDTAAVVFRGQPLFAIYKRVTNHDSTMIRLGEDDSKTYRIYSEHDTGKGKAQDNDKKSEAAGFLKVGIDEYIELRTQKP